MRILTAALGLLCLGVGCTPELVITEPTLEEQDGDGIPETDGWISVYVGFQNVGWQHYPEDVGIRLEDHDRSFVDTDFDSYLVESIGVGPGQSHVWEFPLYVQEPGSTDLTFAIYQPGCAYRGDCVDAELTFTVDIFAPDDPAAEPFVFTPHP